MRALIVLDSAVGMNLKRTTFAQRRDVRGAAGVWEAVANAWV